MRRTMRQFEVFVEEALGGLSSSVRKNIRNVAICVEEHPSSEQLRETGTRKGDLLLGLYEGVPETAWGKGEGQRLPDKITLFRESLELLARSKEELKQLVQDTVRHEVAHYLGFEEEDLPG